MVDYSKFDKLDFSSDEDDCHPNIEINTWRRLKERMREEKGIKKREPDIKDKWNTTSVNAKKTKSPPPSDSAPGDNNTNNPSSINDNKPPTVITSAAPSSTSASSTTQGVENKNTIDDIKTNVKDKPITKEKEIDVLEDIEYYSDPTKFLEQNLNKIKKYGKIKSDLDAIKYLNDNSYLVHEAAEGYLITLAVDLAVEDKMDDSRLTAKRCLEIHNLIKACKSANLKPDKGIELYYKRLSIPAMKAEYLKEFELQFKELWNRIETRKIERLNELNNNDDNNNEYSNEDLAPLGPGGLDPSQVLNSLPKVLQDAFISKDIDHLKYALTQLTPEEASYYMKQCIDSGLWVPGPEDQNDNNNNNGDDYGDDDDDDVNDDKNENDDNGANRGTDDNNNSNDNNDNDNDKDKEVQK